MELKLNPRRVESVLTDADGNQVVVDDGAIHVHIPGEVITGNSSSTPLAADSVFTGSAVDTLDFALFFVTVYADTASATDGLEIQMSSDSITWRDSDQFTIPAGIEKTFSAQPSKRYLRVRYTNSSTLQTVFDLQTVAKRTNSKPSSHRIQDNITTDDDAELVKAVITAQRPDNVFTNIGSTLNNNLRVSINEYGDTPAVDAFARLRISENFTLFDSKQLHDKQPLFWDESLGGSATSIHSSVNAETQMTVTANASDFAIRQTKQMFNYQPGKSQLVFFTFRTPMVTGVTNRVGYFDGTGTNNLTPNNGIFFETDSTISWNIAKNGTITETALKENWNIDPLDGNGPSQITYDPTATQIGIIDFEWLGVGRVRVGFVIDGLIYYVHEFNHANHPSFTSVYMSTPNLPLRYSIETDGTNGSTLSHICSTVISEGGTQKTGVLRVSETLTPLTTLSTGTTYAVTGIKLKAVYKDITVIPESISLLTTGNDSFRWSVVINPTIAGTFTYNDLTNSSVQNAVGTVANTVSDRGLVITSGYSSSQLRVIDTSLNTALKIGSTIAGVFDELVLLVTPITNNITVYGSLNFRELL